MWVLDTKILKIDNETFIFWLLVFKHFMKYLGIKLFSNNETMLHEMSHSSWA